MKKPSKVRPDVPDFRDRIYNPPIHVCPKDSVVPELFTPVLDQDATNACTGFALATVVNYLTAKHRPGKADLVSQFMLYSMARRYDEFPGAKKDEGSSLRGALKGWFKHGACRAELWPEIDMPPAGNHPRDDWWLDAVTRPMGAYYRIDTRSIIDMQIAICESGILYASAVCHDGWEKGYEGVKSDQGAWPIPVEKAGPDAMGHAFAIVGYNASGFLIQNSWGEAWGSKGFALLSYEDWSENAMDCWVAQLGVVTDLHRELAGQTTLRYHNHRVALASSSVLRNRELSPFIVNMENNGQLSRSGDFRTQASDLKDLVNHHAQKAVENWGLADGEPLDVAIYAHGGLVNEKAAAKTAATWIPRLYEARFLPIFLMWETGLWDTFKNRLHDIVARMSRPSGSGLGDAMARWWNRRVERALSAPGTFLWKEMKQNARAITQPVIDGGSETSGGQLLFQFAKTSSILEKRKIRLHLIGHSAGAIAQSHLAEQIGKLGWNLASINFMAAAVNRKTFEDAVLPLAVANRVKKVNLFHLTDEAEQQDDTCRPFLGYGRSLLYLVSEAFEGGQQTPILGMAKYADSIVKDLANVKIHAGPSDHSMSTTHGGFDDDERTIRKVIECCLEAKVAGAESFGKP